MKLPVVWYSVVLSSLGLAGVQWSIPADANSSLGSTASTLLGTNSTAWGDIQLTAPSTYTPRTSNDPRVTYNTFESARIFGEFDMDAPNGLDIPAGSTITEVEVGIDPRTLDDANTVSIRALANSPSSSTNQEVYDGIGSGTELGTTYFDPTGTFYVVLNVDAEKSLQKALDDGDATWSIGFKYATESGNIDAALDRVGTLILRVTYTE